MKCWVVSILGLVYAVYATIGGLIFWALEKGNEEETITSTGQFRTDWLNNHTCVTPDEFDALVNFIINASSQGVTPVNSSTETEPTWTVHTSIYFAVTVITTIGYGNISPATQGGRSFCVIFALIGIPICLVFLAQLGIKINKVINKFDNWLVKKMTCGFCTKHPKMTKVTRLCIAQSVMFTLLMLIPAVIFMAMENGWEYRDALYYCFITMTTIGFGDYVAGFNDVWGHPVYRIMISFWIVFGLAWMASVISMIQDYFDNKVSTVEDKIKEKEKEKEKTKDENEMEKNNHVNLKSETDKL